MDITPVIRMPMVDGSVLRHAYIAYPPDLSTVEAVEAVNDAVRSVTHTAQSTGALPEPEDVVELLDDGFTLVSVLAVSEPLLQGSDIPEY